MEALSSFTYPIMGAILGLSAGISPGPLLTLIIAQTLKHSKTEGIKIAIVPIFTDLPIVIVTILFFSRISHFYTALSIISFLGGIFIAYLGYETVTTKGLNLEIRGQGANSFKKGIVANFLNPNPYIFWMTIGTPLAFKAYAISIPSAVFYFVFFYITLIGSAIIIALLVEKSKALFRNNLYVWVMRVLGMVLFGFSFYLIYDGITMLGK